MKERTSDNEPFFELKSDPTGCRDTNTHNRPCRLKLALNKNLIDDPEQKIL